ncbi:unnamed protein product [Symbiodinium sp. CCMP2456]|nr:unnamed protein product [Symbiodinium sp. CCMP2456]
MCSRRLWALGILLALVSFFSVRQDASTWSLALTKEAKVDDPDARPAQGADDCPATGRHGSRLMYTTWIRPGSSVLEVGARYGQTTCLISKLLEPDSAGARLHASDADPAVWDVLEENLQRHGCHATVVRGPVGTSSLKFLLHNYGSITMSLDDPRPGVVVPAHSLRSLNATFDTLAIDCEGCFGSFLGENPELLEMLSMIIVEVHHEPGPEQEAVDKLISEGWELKQRLRRQREDVPPHASSATGQVQSWTEPTKKDGPPVTSYRRHIYLDMGANWANTLRLYSDLSQSPHRDSAWEVYAFEANPLIQPYVNKFVSFLNGKGPKPPVLIPPAGSNGHLNDLAKRFHCRKKTTDSTRECMVKLFEPQIHALKVEPELSSLQLIHSRMREAAAPPPTAEESRYTFIPTAVGSEDGELKMTDNTARTVLIRGGFGAGNAKKDTSREYHIPMVNVVRWMIDSFRESDYIVVKMDVEGAEHGILSGLLDHGKLGLIDILAFECHAAKTSPACKKLNRRLDKAAAVSKTKILREASGYQGWDHFSTPDRYYPLDPRIGRPQSNG